MQFTDFESGRKFLREVLGKGIPVYVDDVFRKAAMRGISRGTLKELRKEMNIQSAPVYVAGKNVGQVWFFAPERGR